nr:PREDICTED: midasin-like [Stegastes partitus]
MLQQNNNNNYPCLNVSGSTRDMLQKCSRASLPFPSRLELGLGDLPLIRGLRAWALCSKNRHKAGGLLGGGQAPTAPPPGRGTSCPRPADVYLSGEWGRMGYGIPLGLDARQAGIGALVTVATLKTSEGSGKTQTQCLFLRTEKGSCLYSTAKPGSGGTAGVVGGWLRGKTGGGGRDGGPPAQTGANRVRVRSGRRWRKSGSAEKTGSSRERQQRSSWEDPAAEERQEERDKGGPDSKQSSSPQQHCRGGRCCHSASPKACTQCGPGPQRRESQDEAEGGESPSNRQGMRKNEEEEEEEEGLCKSSDCVVAELKPDLESTDSHGSCHVGEAESDGGPKKTETSCGKDDYSERDEDDVVKLHAGSGGLVSEPETEGFESKDVNDGRPGEDSSEGAAADANGFSDQETEKEENISEFSAASGCCQDPPASLTNQSSDATEGSICAAEQETCWVQTVGEADVGATDPNFDTVNEDAPPQIAASSPAGLENSSRTVEPEDPEERLNPDDEGEEVRRRKSASEKLDEGNNEGVKRESDEVEPDGETGTDGTDPPASGALRLANPAPSLPPLGSMATGLPCLEAEEEEEEEEEVVVRAAAGDEEGKLEERGSTVAAEEEEEEDEFGVFMQAEGESAWSEGFTTSASVPCGSRESAAVDHQAGAAESPHWTAGWMDGSFHQSDDTWAAFPQDSSDEGRDVAEQWWPSSAVEERRDRLSTNQNLAAVFAEAFPRLPGSSSSDSRDLGAVPTLTQLLRGRTSQDQGLLDSFHDLNKMIGRRYKRANGVSRDLLLRTLHLEQPQTESRPASWTANRRLSPGLPSANQHAHSAAAKRRLSYDYNRNIME